MIDLSQAVFDHLLDHQENSFIDRIVAFAQTDFLELPGFTNFNLRDAIIVEMRTAEDFGLVTERDIVSYVTAAMLLGSDFVAQPEIYNVLSGPHSADEKATFLEALLLSNEMLGELIEVPDSGIQR